MSPSFIAKEAKGAQGSLSYAGLCTVAFDLS